MAKSYGQKLKILYVLEILKKYSDEAHPLTAEAICERLEAEGISAERKSIYSDISALCEYGFDIIKSSSPKGWFLGEREFEEPEIFLLSDAVRSAKFISPNKSKKLIDKLDSFMSCHHSENNRKVYFSFETKSANEEIFYNIDAISEAINENKKISFGYVVRALSDDREIESVYKKMKISPYALVWQDDHYYVLGNYEKYDNVIQLRLDRMHAVEKVNERVRHFSEVTPYTDYFNTADYTEKLFNMHSGELCEIELRCNKNIIEQIADRFGEGIFIKKVTDTEFSFSVTAAISEALVTWIINYGENIKVIAPIELAEKVTKRAQNILNLYS